MWRVVDVALQDGGRCGMILTHFEKVIGGPEGVGQAFELT